jgi:hypothetical protein
MPYILYNEEGDVLYNETDEVLSESHLSNALKFSTNAQGINCGYGAQYNFGVSSPFSISVWAKPNGNGEVDNRNESAETLLFKNDFTNGEQTAKGWHIICLKADDTHFRILFNLDFRGGFIGRAAIVYTSTTFLYGQWHHIVMTKAATYTAAGVKIYVDGYEQPVILGQNGLLPGDDITSPALPLMIGRTNPTARTDDPYNYDYPLRGLVANVVIFNTTISAAKALELYIDEGFIPSDLLSDVVLDLPLDEKEGTAVKDRSSYNQTCNLTGYTSPAQTAIGVTNHHVDAYSEAPILI